MRENMKGVENGRAYVRLGSWPGALTMCPLYATIGHMQGNETNEDFCRRCPDWDYRQPCYYLLTLSGAGRRPVLGSRVAEREVRRSGLGCVVTRCWARIAE